jgi:hypothetical protein
MRWLISTLLIISITVSGQTLNNAKTESEGLMNAALPFAKKMLEQYGEFIPYGQALNLKNEILAIGAHDGQEHPPSAQIIQLLKQCFVHGAESGQYKATALVYDVRVQLPSTGSKSDAIAVSLNHKDNYSATVFFTYKIENSKLIMGEVFAQQGENDVFHKH